MDELDQLLQELSAPKPKEQPAAAPVTIPQATKVQEIEVPKAQTVDFDELDNLMAELGAPPKKTAAPAAAPVVNPPVTAAAAPVSAPAATNIAVVAPAPTPAVAPKAASQTVDDLLAELSNGLGTPAPAPTHVHNHTHTHAPAAAPKAAQELDELDNVMNALQGMNTGGAAPTPVAQPAAGGISRKNELDNILSSLTSEMNQIGVDSNFKGQCARCKRPVIGQVVTAIGKTWHPECFSCLQCRKPLGTTSFFEKDSNPFCEKCYYDMFSPKCAYCDGPIRDKCVNALGKTWHPDHFFCSQCGKSFAGVGFMEKDGKAYCEEDYFNMFAPKCGNCEKPIMAECITALGRQWHVNCFVCMDKECKQPFNSGAFFDYEGKPYCEKHYHSQKGSLCASCQKPITGRCITAIGKRFHPEHFVCAFCMKQLAQGAFKDNSGKPYCMGCHVKLFG